MTAATGGRTPEHDKNAEKRRRNTNYKNNRIIRSEEKEVGSGTATATDVRTKITHGHNGRRWYGFKGG